jgi:hypothetical protein
MLPAVLLWAAPFLIIPVSFIFFRFLPFHKARYLSYGVLLLAAFFLNLFRFTFHNDLFDTILRLVVNFIGAEFFWNLLRLKKMKVFIPLLILALGLYGFQFKRWIVSGPSHGYELWKDAVATTYRAKSAVYSLKERDLFNTKRPGRLLILSKQIGSSPFEREISRYRTPPGFRKTDFLYTWSTTPQGVRLDLHVPGFDRQIWTMGEGF